jgi:hypothetical protein
MAGEIYPGILLVKINGSNQIGAGYEAVVRIVEGGGDRASLP